MAVTTQASLDELVSKVSRAQEVFSTFSQETVDRIFAAAAFAAAEARIPLAKMAWLESGMGILEDKVIKNHFASEYIYNQYKGWKTVGVISEDDAQRTQTVAEPVGVICGIVPTTNPTSTAIFKSLLALKTRNGIVFSPHPRAARATNAAARIVLEAAVAAGAPEGIIGWIDEPSIELTNQLMHHPSIALILATGGPKMVQAAYSSGKPALGVGAGNVPVVVDEYADVQCAVSSVLLSKTFDNGLICASEQAVVAVDSVYEAVKSLFLSRGCYFLNEGELQAVRSVLMSNGSINAQIVGQSASYIAELAGLNLKTSCKLLIGEVSDYSEQEVFAHEKLSPTLALYRANSFEAAVKVAEALVELGGLGHTSVLYTDQDQQKERIAYFSSRMKTGRVLINMPAVHGALGDLYNFQTMPSLTLGCGSWGRNSVSENVSPKHLLNYKTIAKRAENMLWMKLPSTVYFRRGSFETALKEVVQTAHRIFVVTDSFLFKSNYLAPLEKLCIEHGVKLEIFHDVPPDPMMSIIRRGAEAMFKFEPDVVLALGGGSPMDAAKVMRLIYENPEVQFEALALRFMDIRKRIYQFPPAGTKARLIAVPTTSGTGAEVTPFAVVTDDATGNKYPLADYALTPDMAIIDADLVMRLPPELTAYGGMDAITHALEAYASVLASEYTNGHALKALRLLKDYLPESYSMLEKAPLAREKVHDAATIAGLAFANAFLGVCHSMAHKLGAKFHLPHGLANALLITNVVRFNAMTDPTKQTAFSQYRQPQGQQRYAAVADALGLTRAEMNDGEKVECLINWLEELKSVLSIPSSIQAAGIGEELFLSHVDELAEEAFDDQCTPANPRYPLISELRALLLASYYGTPYSGETAQDLPTSVELESKPVGSTRKRAKPKTKSKPATSSS